MHCITPAQRHRDPFTEDYDELDRVLDLLRNSPRHAAIGSSMQVSVCSRSVTGRYLSR